MFVLGITGSVGAGKSTLMRLLRRGGYVTLSADKIFHYLLARDPHVHNMLKRLGVAPTRPALWAWLEQDAQHWPLWQAFTGALIARELHRRLLTLQRLHIAAVAIEIPLLFELGLGVLVHQVIGAESSQTQQKLRLKRRGLSPKRRAAITVRGLPAFIATKLADDRVLTKGIRGKTGQFLAQAACKRTAVSTSNKR
ncbi:MAG: dephospho-CoA kinase [Holosporales bacterium]